MPRINLFLLTRISKLGGSTGGDIFIKEDGVVISGYSKAPILQNFCSGTSQFIRWNSGLSIFFLLRQLFLNRWFILIRIKGTTNSSGGQELIINMAEKLKPFIGDEITKAYIDIKNKPFSQNSLVIYELGNRVQCENIFWNTLEQKPGSHISGLTNRPEYLSTWLTKPDLCQS